MKPVKINLPIRYQGDAVAVGWLDGYPCLFLRGQVVMLVADKRLMALIGVLLSLLLIHALFGQEEVHNTQKTVIQIESPVYEEDVLGYSLDYFEQYEPYLQINNQNFREAFLVQKHLLVSRYLVGSRVSRLDQLPDADLLELTRQISQLFMNQVMGQIYTEPHVYTYFTDTSELSKIQTALVEQIKFHVPASIKLAQSALETGYGKRVVHNNYFGIKDRSGQNGPMETTEYYNEAELRANRHKVVTQEKIQKGGLTLYKCRVRDHFAGYPSAWASFRAHSMHLASNQRYAPLFTKGKDYRAWAEKIGSTKYGGVGYATSPVYGELLKKIIQRYELHLLDF